MARDAIDPELLKAIRDHMATRPSKPSPETLEMWWSLGHGFVSRLLDIVELLQSRAAPRPQSQRHPMQPFVVDAKGVIRFKSNAIVDHLLERDSERGRTFPEYPARSDGGLNHLSSIADCFPQEDWEQFLQLIGYSLSGYHELSHVSDESALEASEAARKIMPECGGCRDTGCEIHVGVEREDGKEDGPVH